ncbi:hypothetical protein EDC39_102252 [Geothermobacter ehrlichii]|uniref:Uncharacterized protein n=1 Tax=Geothermobacter ehrlichii TaxID=213224 RepID=A0A5D3WMV8_9BACT|nr:hypothetical protein [Geothermobacter ehrlichii]TYO99726.1 hypothetical protein EDC39_102252 [Geothermobacter ehrlichii]
MTAGKEIVVAFYGMRFPRRDWSVHFDWNEVMSFLEEQTAELAPLGIRLKVERDSSRVIDINGYGDLLNAVRLRSSQDGLGNPCLGHVIGASADLDFLADLKRGIGRIAFAPEMIAPDTEYRKVCHNCGCGC